MDTGWLVWILPDDREREYLWKEGDWNTMRITKAIRLNKQTPQTGQNGHREMVNFE